MKSAPFDYVRPRSLQEALGILQQQGDDAKILGGGQSLMPMLALRLVNPELVVDINRLPELDFIDTANGLRLGALIRWHRIETDPAIAAAHPLLAYAMHHVAHYQIRSRGTWAGSCAHADPSAEFPAIAILSQAEFVLRSARGARTLRADDFFMGLLTTALEPDEILCEVQFPAWPSGRAWAFEEFAMRSGDFALAGAAVFIDPATDDAPAQYSIVAFGSGERAYRRPLAEAVLAGAADPVAAISEAAAAGADEVECQGDLHASGPYRHALTRTMLERALHKAFLMASETR